MEPYSEELSRRMLMRVHTSGLPYDWLANPYRGASHPCAYCYSTGSHAERGHDGLAEFEPRVVVKPNAATVLRAELQGATTMRGVVGLGAAYDPYGPAELRHRLTQQVLGVLLAARQPGCVVTASALVLRDLALLAEVAQHSGLRVIVTLCSLDERVWRHVEPEASTPQARLTALARLTAAGIPAGLALAPLLPDLTDDPASLETLVQAAVEHGARFLAPHVPHLEHSGVEWALPGIRMLHPHLPSQHVRRYRGPHRPEHYTRDVMAGVEHLRRRYGLAERVELPRAVPARGQLALEL